MQARRPISIIYIVTYKTLYYILFGGAPLIQDTMLTWNVAPLFSSKLHGYSKANTFILAQTSIYILQYYILVFVPFCMYVQTCISFFALLLYYLITISRPTRIFFLWIQVVNIVNFIIFTKYYFILN